MKWNISEETLNDLITKGIAEQLEFGTITFYKLLKSYTINGSK